jgi:HEPN domain-containing protein
MTPFIDEAKRLLRIAGRDYQTFTILRNHPEAELAPTCFHAQQAVEKALKAVLTIKHIDFRCTQDLEELATCSPILALPHLSHLGNSAA